MKLALVPLDERPCNEYFPKLVGKIADVEVITPPREMLGCKREPGQYHRLDQWLLEVADQVDGFVISIETLVYGGLIPSRIGYEATEECLGRLEVLRKLREKNPKVPVYAFNIVMRTSNSYVNEEEPEYWDRYGKDIFRYSQLIDRVLHLGFEQEREKLEKYKKKIPAEIIADYTTRRERNHQVNRAMVDLVAEGVVDFLLFTQDDTSEFGYPNIEQRKLREKISELGVEDKALVYPGADEVGMVLVGRHVNRHLGITPRFFPRYSSVRGPLIVASYEDRPIAESVKGQIFGLGGMVVDSPQDADIILCLNTPGEKQGEAPIQDRVLTVDTSARNLLEFVHAMKMYEERGYVVALADLAYANGADLKLIPLLQRLFDLPKLGAFGAWNTAGNTLGTVVAHAAMRYIARKHYGDREDLVQAHLEFLLLRFADDWAYQSVVRTELREDVLPARNIPILELGDSWEEIQSIVQQRLPEVMNDFFTESFAGRPVPGESEKSIGGMELKNVHLPWKRIFEVGCDVALTLK